jgi:hypothetical protein
MESITKNSVTLAEALMRMRAKVLTAEEAGKTVVSIGIEDALDLKDAAHRCENFSQMADKQNQGFMDGVQSQRISGLQSCAKWARERSEPALDDFADFLDGLAADWTKREQARAS